ncbi:hypothetical protein [Paenibacillus thiaminolyticus]|uniref:Uncharacterized protein n=1 Tax=Paenibacillus thiaminolyticus TaxID=49283 RepID=A0A3A3GYW7_PANTH|nr:hypothetical protein [Paenibacillus thiaminolyticus]RJG21445.1 hypothetical protein DQX05_21470 [Paenibacillus thiaminolyticus]
MVNKLSYDKVIKYVTQGFEKYLSDGLTVSQATSRSIVELEIQTDDFEDVEWTLYLLLAKLGIEHGDLRDDIKAQAMDIINSNKLVDFWKKEGLDNKELEERVLFVKGVRDLLTTV